MSFCYEWKHQHALNLSLQVRRLRIQQRIKSAELGILQEEQENELPSFPSFIPFLPPLVSFQWFEVSLTLYCLCIIASLFMFYYCSFWSFYLFAPCFRSSEHFLSPYYHSITCRAQQTSSNIMLHASLLSLVLCFLEAFWHLQ